MREALPSHGLAVVTAPRSVGTNQAFVGRSQPVCQKGAKNIFSALRRLKTRQSQEVEQEGARHLGEQRGGAVTLCGCASGFGAVLVLELTQQNVCPHPLCSSPPRSPSSPPSAYNPCQHDSRIFFF